MTDTPTHEKSDQSAQTSDTAATHKTDITTHLPTVPPTVDTVSTGIDPRAVTVKTIDPSQFDDRRSQNRALPNSPIASELPVPDEPLSTVSAGASQFFDEDGNLRSPTDFAQSDTQLELALENYSLDFLESVLADVSPQQYNRYLTALQENAFSDVDNTTILKHAFRTVCEDTNTDFAQLLERSGYDISGLVHVITHHQEQSPDTKLGGDLPSDSEVRAAILPDDVSMDLIECPECGSSCSRDTQQMGAADEGQTVFIRCNNSDCDYNARAGY